MEINYLDNCEKNGVVFDTTSNLNIERLKT